MNTIASGQSTSQISCCSEHFLVTVSTFRCGKEIVDTQILEF